MSSDALEIDYAFERGWLVEDEQVRDDHKTAVSFLRLRGHSHRPQDRKLRVRDRESFLRIRNKLPHVFFDALNRLLELVAMPQCIIAPDPHAIAQWNRPGMSREVAAAVARLLDEGSQPALIPLLVSTFSMLEWQRHPSHTNWQDITAIAIPGSRSYDRAAEAFRAYLRTNGRAILIASGSAPYYDPRNSGLSINEAEAIAAYLRMLGVPQHRIYIERESRDTYENAAYMLDTLQAIRAQGAMGKMAVLLVTSPFHVARYRMNAEIAMDQTAIEAEIFAIASASSRFRAETYFMSDERSGFTREQALRVVVDEYLKIAFDVCSMPRAVEAKLRAFKPSTGSFNT